MSVRIQERFVSYQGSGLLAGERQYFVRMQGCSILCPIRSVCDEQSALPLTGGELLTPEEIVDAAKSVVAENGWLHLTGGEPMSQKEAVYAILSEAKKADLRVHMQTSGLVLAPRPDFITVSPKVTESGLKHRSGDEMILVYDPAWVSHEVARTLYTRTAFKNYFLQPLWVDGECNAKETVEFCETMNRCGLNWNITGQLHKFFGIK